MKIICMVKIVPDVSKFKYDFDHNTVVRENVRMILNPDDACSVGFALKVKNHRADTTVEVVTMAPSSAMPILEDLVRMGVDRVTMLSDRTFSGSDSYATSRTLSAYLKDQDYDCIFTGTHAIDGDTSHIPAQLAELLSIGQMSHIIEVDENVLSENRVVFQVERDSSVNTYEMILPGILSFSKESKYKLPFIKYENMYRDVQDQIQVITNETLKLPAENTGTMGSLTKVNRTFIKTYEKRDKLIVKNDEAGIEEVYSFLKSKGYV